MPGRPVKPLDIMDSLDEEQPALTVSARYTTWGLLPRHVSKLKQCVTERGMSDTVDDAQAVFDELESALRRGPGGIEQLSRPGIFRLVNVFRPTTVGRKELLALDASDQDTTRQSIEEAVSAVDRALSYGSQQPVSEYHGLVLERIQTWTSDLMGALSRFTKESGESDDEHIRRYFSHFTDRMVEVVKKYELKEWLYNRQQSYKQTSSLGKRRMEDDGGQGVLELGWLWMMKS